MMLAGRYQLIEPVGHGGMAEVWRAEDLSLGRPVAVKILTSPVSAGDEAVQDAWREAREAARLVHPNVVGVYDVGIDDGRPFLVMEWVAGRDLAAVLGEQGPPPAVQVAAIGAQTARALAAAHAVGVVHRDVKPGNLLVSADGTVKLADFGTATLAGGVAGALVGTGAYVAPEQALGGPAGAASDLYALGCVLYELLIGHPPFISDDPAVLLRSHVEAEPVPPGQLRRDVPAVLEQAILHLLVKNPAERPYDAGQVAEVLQSISNHLADARDTAAGPMTTTQVLPTLGPGHGGPAGLPLSDGGWEPELGAPPARPPLSTWLGQRPLLAATVGAVVIIAVMAALVAMMTSSDPGTHTPAMPATSEPPSQQPTLAGKTPQPQLPQSPAELMAALEQRLGQQVSDGQLDSEVAADIGKKTDEIDHKLAKGKNEDMANSVAEIRKKLNEAAQDGKWTPDPAVFSLLDRLDVRGGRHREQD